MKLLTDEMIQGAIDRNPEYQVVPHVSIQPTMGCACLLGVCAVDAGFLEDHDLANYHPTAERMGKHLDLNKFYAWGVAHGFDHQTASSKIHPSWAASPSFRQGVAVGQKWREKLGYPVARDYSAEATP